jgi:hypothetical protein|tara:strand:+ start:2364 stop:2900 length:537 start_codon:yes stop_codon:yes gene_type:complete
MTYNNVNNLSVLVTPSQVVTYAFTNTRFDQTLISDSMIKLAEIQHLEKPLSRQFYEELVTQHHNGTLTTDNNTLLNDYLYRTLSWFVKFEVMNETMYNVTSTGVVMNIDDFSQGVTQKQFDLMKQDVYRKGQAFLQDTLDFVSNSANINNYQTYRDNRSDSSTHNDGTANKHNGIIFY